MEQSGRLRKKQKERSFFCLRFEKKNTATKGNIVNFGRRKHDPAKIGASRFLLARIQMSKARKIEDKSENESIR